LKKLIKPFKEHP